jgi:hypothetical protein
MFTFFLEELFRRLDAGKLPHPSFIVGQTGTLTRLTENVGRFDKDAARQLARAAAQRGVGLKEHNADYLPDSMLLGHPRWGITAANVAPEFGCVETKAYLDLAALEQQEYGPAASSLGAVLRDEAIRTQRWRKWMVGDWAAEQDLDKVRRDEGVSRQITLTCGHYTFGAEAFRREFAKLSGNLEALGICPEQYALGKVMAAMDRYALCLGLCGLTGKLLGEPPMS